MVLEFLPSTSDRMRFLLQMTQLMLFTNVSHVQSALDLFEQQMPNMGLQPDIITYNSLLRAVGRSKDDNLAAAVLHLYDKLCHSSELTPDKHTFSAVFSAAMQLNITDGSYLLQVQLSLVCISSPRHIIYIASCQ